MASSVKAEIGLLRVAWAASSENARRQFLSELVGKICAPLAAPAERRSPDGALSAFLTASLARGGSADRIQASRLYGRYVSWCDRAGETPLSNRGFVIEMQQRGYKGLHSNVHWWIGVKPLQPL